MNEAELHRRQQLLEDMDRAAYECAGGLLGILMLHKRGLIELPPSAAKSTERMCAAFEAFHAQYRAIDAIDKAKAV